MPGPIYQTDPDPHSAVELEGLTLLFHPRSGMTHIVAPPAPQILAALAQGPADAATLLARLTADFDFGDQDAATAVAARLAELETAGLISRA